MIRTTAIALVLLSALFAHAGTQQSTSLKERRCGWFWNPTPGNAWLDDSKGRWLLSRQGGGESDADGEWPDFPDQSQWVITNAGSYGYGCACMTIERPKGSRQVTRILDSKAQALAVCRSDRQLKRPE